jgi:hypothetical protein
MAAKSPSAFLAFMHKEFSRGGPDCLQSGRRRHKRRYGNRQIALAPIGPVPMECMIGS